ncbi:hypothetical protein [Citrobacter sp. RHBSTW-00271]|uniref:hypothetical protein n=1 Tax=Citrobacter sp. RHBSTW-00271 TaxID=2742642 RepID=UPI0015F9A3D4|nr:hypothetical protein [Citrobacter sp. RHBSTW-00271]MBA7942506.1 hypothetical protein [Citrobacter sp. RHBSTW-00271]
MILVISSSFDQTIDYIKHKHNVDNFYRFNIDNFSSYAVFYDQNGFSITDLEGRTLLERNCSSIYYRKPTPELLSQKIDSKYHNHLYREVFSLADGISEAFRGKCLTKPSLLRKADNKIFQLREAYGVGFNIPSPLITNNIEIIKSYFSKPIIKPLSSGIVEYDSKREYVQTNLVDFNKDTSHLKYGPCYFQEFQNKEYEVRITIIDNYVYPVKIISENKIDWRKNNNKIQYELIDIPNQIRKQCFNLMKKLDISFGCFDFIVMQDKWYFLEVNANGQWVWLEMELGLDISSKILRHLQC